MKKRVIYAILMLSLLSTQVFAGGRHGGHGHGHGRGHRGGGGYWSVVVNPFWLPLLVAPRAVYYSTPVDSVPAFYPPVETVDTPPTYIEQPQADNTEVGRYWYYCAESQAYYPDVQACAGGWHRVLPRGTSEP